MSFLNDSAINFFLAAQLTSASSRQLTLLDLLILGSEGLVNLVSFRDFLNLF